MQFIDITNLEENSTDRIFLITTKVQLKKVNYNPLVIREILVATHLEQ
jgi:hypothetical protein